MPEQKIEHKIKKKKKAFMLLLFLIIVLTLALIFAKSDYFNIKNIVITGNKLVPTQEIEAQIDLYNKNIFFVNKISIKKKIYQEPYIEEIKIYRRFPSTINITIKEKQIKGIVKYQNNFIDLDKNGRMLHVINKFPDGSIPLIEGLTVKQYIPNGNIIDDEIKQRVLATVLTITNFQEFRNVVSSINLSDLYNITFITTYGIDINIGDWNNFDYKLSYAYAILNSSKVKGNKGCIEIQSIGTAIFKKY